MTKRGGHRMARRIAVGSTPWRRMGRAVIDHTDSPDEDDELIPVFRDP